MPFKSLVLFEEEKPYQRHMSMFYNPKIQMVSVIVEGKPYQLYAQGMQLFEQYMMRFANISLKESKGQQH